MGYESPITRRRMIGGLGAAGIATAAGVGLAGPASAAPRGDQNEGAEPVRGVAPATLTPQDLENPIVQTLGAIDFQPANAPAALAYDYVVPGGVQVTAGAAFFNAGLRLPVGATIVGARVFVNPNGTTVNALIERYDPLTPAFEELANGSSTTGTSPEAIDLAIDHEVEAGWNYRIDNISLGTGGPILYGAEVTYTIPADPTGVFVPFVGTNPRVYDSRVSGGKLGANEERVIPLGVPGTVKAAVFNLTVTETQGAGFVACFKANVGWPGNSSINWYESGANVANLVVSAVDGTGQIRVRGGVDSTHVVIDLIGTFA